MRDVPVETMLIIWTISSLVMLLWSLTWFWARGKAGPHRMDGVFGPLAIVSGIVFVFCGIIGFVMGVS